MQVGLCETCLHHRVVKTTRSAFSLCERAKTDARFSKYPQLPVVACRGFEPR